MSGLARLKERLEALANNWECNPGFTAQQRGSRKECASDLRGLIAYEGALAQSQRRAAEAVLLSQDVLEGRERVTSPVTSPCSACGLDLTPTPEQLRALWRFGNPLRRQPCLETEDGLHIVADSGPGENDG